MQVGKCKFAHLHFFLSRPLKRMIPMRPLRALLFLSLLVFAGCGGTVTLITDTISPTPSISVDSGQSVTFTAAVKNDTSNSGVLWSTQGGGTLSSVTPTSVVYTAPTVTAAASANVTATPAKNSLFAASTLISVSPGLAITSSTLATGKINTAYSAQLTTTGGTGTITFALVSGSLPAGLTLSPTGLISGTPSASGSSTFVLSATDQASTPMVATKGFTLNVTATALLITTKTLPNGVVGTAYSQQLVATGGTTPYTWSVVGGNLPTGLTLSQGGLLSGIPSANGSYNFSVQVKDSGTVPQTATQTFSGVVIYSALSITTASLPNGSLKNAYSQTLQATGGQGTYTWSLTSGTVPGLTLSTTGVLSGTPTTAGTYSLTVQVTDQSIPQTATRQFSLTIVTSTLAIATTTLPAATDTVSYTTTLTSTGGNPPVTWSLANGSALPLGLTLSTTGTLSGTTTATAGTYTFTVQATDTTPYTVSQQLSLTVNGLAALTITTTTVPNANIGSAYSTTLAASGGATPYTWSLTGGALPTGLSLSSAGVITGTPVAPGSYNFTVQVKDSQSTPATASRSFTLTVGTTLGAGAGNALLNGSYAFLLQGYGNGVAANAVSGFAAIGSLTATGTGTLTGIEDLNTPTGVTTNAAVTGTYSLGTDGRGLMVLAVNGKTVTYAIVASNLSGTVAQSLGITEFDNSTGSAGTANASGYAKLQTTSAFTAAGIKGTYAFGLNGESPCSACATGVKLGPVVTVGTFTADGVSALTAGAEDAGAYATSYTGITFTGAYSAPSATSGRGTLTVTNTGTLFAAPPLSYTYVIVNAGELLLMSNTTHATTSLLAGDVRLSATASYTAASLSGTMVGYESQAANGNGTTTLPASENAILSRVAITGSGTATLAQDANKAGTFTSTAAAAIAYTTAANGRTALGSQVIYPYAANAAFALDSAGTGTYPGLIAYEGFVAVAPFPPLLSGTFGAYTLATAVPSTDTSGNYVFSSSTGGVDAGLSGTLMTTLDSSSPAGTLSLGTTASQIYAEDANGRITTFANGSAAVGGVVYAITATRAASIAAGSTLTPIVTVLQK
jgi:hypothetical protein